MWFQSDDKLWEELYGVEEIEYPRNWAKIGLITVGFVMVGVLVWYIM